MIVKTRLLWAPPQTRSPRLRMTGTIYQDPGNPSLRFSNNVSGVQLISFAYPSTPNCYWWRRTRPATWRNGLQSTKVQESNSTCQSIDLIHDDRTFEIQFIMGLTFLCARVGSILSLSVAARFTSIESVTTRLRCFTPIFKCTEADGRVEVRIRWISDSDPHPCSQLSTNVYCTFIEEWSNNSRYARTT